MNRGKKFTLEQIIKILREVEIHSGQGKTIAQATRSCSITEQTYYRCYLKIVHLNSSALRSTESQPTLHYRLYTLHQGSA